MDKMTVGTDSEFFVFRPENGKIVPMTGKLKADKKHPKEIHKWNHLSVQEDGISIELTFDAARPSNFCGTAEQAYWLFEDWLRRNFEGLSIHPLCEVNVSEVEDYPAAANRLGCDPDYEAYVLPVSERPTPIIEDFHGWRFGSGHIHFGTKGVGCADEVPAYIQAQFADLLVGVPLRFGCGADELHRIEFYGKPGLYRPKPYGFEYRTPSNMWMGRHAHFNDNLHQFESLFEMRIQELKTLYKRVDWNFIRKCLSEPGSNSPNMIRWQEHIIELRLEARVA